VPQLFGPATAPSDCPALREGRPVGPPLCSRRMLTSVGRGIRGATTVNGSRGRNRLDEIAVPDPALCAMEVRFAHDPRGSACEIVLKNAKILTTGNFVRLGLRVRLWVESNSRSMVRSNSLRIGTGINSALQELIRAIREIVFA